MKFSIEPVVGKMCRYFHKPPTDEGKTLYLMKSCPMLAARVTLPSLNATKGYGTFFLPIQLGDSLKAA